MGIPACAECARNCILIHGKNKKPSPVVQSFFKIMIGDNFSKVLFLPPKIGQTMPDLVSKETQLEDASGQRWTVTLSWREESLAFRQGWSSFSREHGLEVGDLLVFHYILGSHFVVQIYGKSGCERLHFSAENGSRKKRRTNTPSGAKDGKYHSTHNSMNKQGQVTSALSGSSMEIVTDNAIVNGSPRKMLNEEQLCMIGMDARHRQEDHRNSLCDLSYFEVQRTSDVDGVAIVLEREMSSCHGSRMLTSQSGAGMVDKIPATEKVVSPDVDRIPVTEKVVALDVPNLDVPEANEDLQMMDHRNSLYHLSKFEMQRTSNVDGVAVVSGHEVSSCRGSRMLTSQAGADMVDRIPATEKVVAHDVLNLEVPEANEDLKMTEKLVLVSTKDFGNGNTIGQEQSEKSKSREKIKAAKTKQLEMRTEVCGSRDVVNGMYPEPKDSGCSSNHPAKKEDHVVFKVVKPEPFDTFDSPSADSGTTSLMVTEAKAFLELPKGFPRVKTKFFSADKFSRRAVVLLLDPESRLWPVAYHEKSQIKALTSGWEAFVKENSIRPGDDCAFEVMDKSEDIFKVSVIRKIDSRSLQ